LFQIGNEFASVEALWSQFESVMGREDEDGMKEASASGSMEGLEERESNGQKQGS
jgi:DASH complex subunit DAD1